MKPVFSALTLIAALCFAAPLPALAQGTPAFGPQSLAPLVEKLLPAVVNISSTQKMAEGPAMQDQLPEMPQFPPGSPFQDFFEEFMNRHGGNGMPSLPPASLGSGFIIDAAQGLIVTNAHVIQDADKVRVTLHDDTTMPAEVIGRDEKTDLALLKVETTHKLTAVSFGNSAPLRVGDWILAIGNPFGLGGTVTTGIVSAQQRDINAGPYDDFIQTDASINRGNSGGPMFNMNGEVIGINTAIYSPSGGSVGIGFAIPSNLAKPVIDQLVKYGKTRRGWLGVRIQTVTEDIAESLSLETHGGALVASVTPTGPAEKAGLKAGDIILEFDGKSVTQMRTLPRIVAETEIGRNIPLVYWRDGKKEKTMAVVGELEKAEEDGLITGIDDPALEEGPRGGVAVDMVGMTLGNITEQDRSLYDIPDDVEGVMIVEVRPDSESMDKGLGLGDVIVEINQQAATDAKTALDIITKAEKSGRTSVLLLVNRAGDVRFVALRLNTGKTGTNKTSAPKTDAAPDKKSN
jgi:serine protease Do